MFPAKQMRYRLVPVYVKVYGNLSHSYISTFFCVTLKISHFGPKRQFWQVFRLKKSLNYIEIRQYTINYTPHALSGTLGFKKVFHLRGLG